MMSNATRVLAFVAGIGAAFFAGRTLGTDDATRIVLGETPIAGEVLVYEPTLRRANEVVASVCGSSAEIASFELENNFAAVAQYRFECSS